MIILQRAEFLGFFAPVNKIRQYVSGDITEDELIDNADVYISDRDMVVDIKKIKIALEQLIIMIIILQEIKNVTINIRVIS